MAAAAVVAAEAHTVDAETTTGGRHELNRPQDNKRAAGFLLV
jgi:hypothetical protein